MLLIIYYNASNYQLLVFEYEKERLEIVETLGDGYDLRQEETQEEKEKIKEVADYLIYRALCEPLCL